jgi:LuxR family maltose regulon positive regulatory protein
LLTAEHTRLISAGKLDLFMTSLERLPEAELEAHPVLAAAGSLVAGILGQPAARRRRLAAIAEANRHLVAEREQRYVEAVVMLTSAAMLDTDLESALDYANRAVELARSDVGEFIVMALAVLAHTHYLRGDATAARQAADEAVGRPEAPQRPHGLLYAHALLALLECDDGHPHAAETRARGAVAEARDLGLAGVWSSALAHHALGQALLTLGRAGDAERELERAETLRRAPEPRHDHAHSLLVLAEARIARGRLTLAATELEAAVEQLDTFADVGRLRSLAASVERQLDEGRAGSSRAVEPPTIAELSVLRMLATDLSQREIGSEPFLSLNTVKTHAHNLYGKLGVHSREAAVRQAHTLGLIETDDSPG